MKIKIIPPGSIVEYVGFNTFETDGEGIAFGILGTVIGCQKNSTILAANYYVLWFGQKSIKGYGLKNLYRYYSLNLVF